MLMTHASFRLSGLCAALPSHSVLNDVKIAQTTGITSRRVAASGTTVVDLCVQAAQKVLADTHAQPADFGAIVFVSFTQKNRMPSGAAQAQARLQFPTDLIAFDVSLACSGWGYGLSLAAMLAEQTNKKVLLLDGDVQSAFVNPDDINTASLFSDGGTAAIVEPGDDAAFFSFATDGAKGEALKLEEGGTITMDGFAVFRFVATDVVRHIKTFLSSLPTQPSFLIPHPLDSSLIPPPHPLDSSLIPSLTFVPHQPNVYMVRQLAKSLGFDEAQTALSCDRFGNLSSASVPVTIAANGVRGPILFSGFGGGLSISIGRMNIPSDCALSLIEV